MPIEPGIIQLVYQRLRSRTEKRRYGSVVIGEQKIYCLLFADDVVLIAEKDKELRQMIKTLEQYTDKNNLEVNAEKTKIMICMKGGGRRKIEEIWTWKENEIEKVKKFKYLGHWFTATGNPNHHLKERAASCQTALNHLWGIWRRSELSSVKKMFTLYESIVESSTTFGQEMWGWRGSEDMERVHAKCVKAVLGLRRDTPDYIWKLESGRLSVDTRTFEKK